MDRGLPACNVSLLLEAHHLSLLNPPMFDLSLATRQQQYSIQFNQFTFISGLGPYHIHHALTVHYNTVSVKKEKKKKKHV